MARNGSGTYSRVAGTPYTYNTVIDQVVVNSEMDDIATALTNSLAKNGETTPTANLPMGTFKHTGVGEATARTDYARASQVQDSSLLWCSTAGGTADAFTLMPSPAITAYAAGQAFHFLAVGTNTGAVTVNISGVGAKAVQASGSALAGGEIVSGKLYSIRYDGTQFQLECVSVTPFLATLLNAANAAAARATLGAWGGAASDIASAATLDLTANAVASDYLRITGTTGVTAVTLEDGQRRWALAGGAFTLTNSANLILQGGANYTTTAGDMLLFVGEPSSVVMVFIWKADGTAVASGASGAFATGMGMALHGATVPSGWILADGRTIGDGSSGATNRANADCQALFTEFWNSMTDTEAPVSGGRGASAAADWAAHKTIQVPDGRGRVVAGKDNMGGTTASRLTNGGSGITGTTLGTAGGTETHTLTTAQLASHTHTVWGRGAGTGSATSFVNTSSVVTDGDINMQTIGAGSGNAHQNTQPTLIANWIIKL